MPTGYTADIYENFNDSFRDFALGCSRAFGAFIHQRDEPQSTPPRLPEVEAHVYEDVEKARLELNRIMARTDDEWLAEYEAVRAQITKDNEERAAVHIERINAYTIVYAKALEWEPPTPAHNEFKSFVLDQLERGRKFDCGSAPYFETLPESLTSYKAKQITLASQRYTARLTDVEKAEQKNVERTEWITQLFASLEDAE